MKDTDIRKRIITDVYQYNFFVNDLFIILFHFLLIERQITLLLIICFTIVGLLLPFKNIKRNCVCKKLSTKIDINKTGSKFGGVAHRPPQMYTEEIERRAYHT